MIEQEISTIQADKKPQSFEQSNALRKKAHDLIPGGCHSISKGDDQFPVLSPGFIARGKGCHVWDVDGNEFIEYGMGLRAVTLGHAYEPVVEAASRQMRLGTNFTRPAAIEVECAERLLELIPSAEMVKFTKNGSTANSAAIKLARAVTGRTHVGICQDHPFFAHNDWFIVTTDMDAGIPDTIREYSPSFRYNDLASIEELFATYPGRIAALIMEAARVDEPQDHFLQETRRLCHEHGALLILDEMITGFRWHLHGAQSCYDVEPDLCTFGKAMGNGFSIAALAGKREFMHLGGLDHDQPRLYFLSATHGAETHSLAAAVETMRIYREEDVIGALYRQGTRLQKGVEQVSAALGLQRYFYLQSRPCNLVFVTCDASGEPSQAFRTLFMQELIRGGVLAPSFVISRAHTDEDVDRTIQAVEQALKIYRRALEEGVEHYLIGRPVKPSMRRYN